MSGRVIVIGSSNTDLIFRTGELPRPGETVLGAGLHVAAGGKGANQAVAAARMGAPTAFVGRIGKDLYGDRAVEALRRERIDVSRVVRDAGSPSGVAVVIVDRRGGNSIVVALGSNMALSRSDVDKVEFHPGDVLALQLEIPLETVIYAAWKGAKAGAVVILNPAPAAGLPQKLMRCVDWIVPNRIEASLLTGLKVESLDEVEAAAAALAKRGAKNVIITLGKQGLWLRSGNYNNRISSHRVRAVDTTAAGDAFVGAFAARLARRNDPLEAVSWARAAAAIAVTRLGAQPSLPKGAEVKGLKNGKPAGRKEAK